MRFITALLVTIIFTVGLIISGFMIKQGLVEFRSADRYVTVKGLAEQDVKADLAVWPITFKVAGDDLTATQTELKRQEQAIRTFMQKYDIAAEEISVQQIQVSDALAQQYRPENMGARYAIDEVLVVRTNNVDAVALASANISELIGDGILIGYGVLPQYSYTQLNAVKPEMIAAATENARQAAQQFANDSGAKVGTIRSATQGYFSITSRDEMSGGAPDSASLFKKVRVVSTVDYYIHD